MDIGLLILRLTLAIILFTHATQKSFGWFGGKGFAAMSGYFEGLGLRPGGRYVIAAAVAEAGAAAMLLIGVGTPAAAAIAGGTMLAAGYAQQSKSGSFWNAGGGGEFPYVLGVASLALAFTGPGSLSIDAVIAVVLPVFGLAAAPPVWAGAVAVAAALLALVACGAVIRAARRASHGLAPE